MPQGMTRITITKSCFVDSLVHYE